MGLGAYLKDRAGAACVLAVAIAFAALVLCVHGVDMGVVAFVCAVLTGAALLALVIDYLRRRGFYCELADTLDGLEDRAYLASELVEHPGTLDERLFYDAFDRVSHAARDEVAAAHRASDEYRDYVEAWVHEIKTPIAAARLTARNNAGPAMEAVGRDLDEVDGYVEQALFYARSTALEADYQLREVVLADAAREAVQSRATALIGAGVTPELGEGLDLAVRSDAKWLVFILAQLLVNAAKYRRDDGQPAHVRMWAERESSGLDVALTRLYVVDDGIGIPASDVPRVFDKGFTGENGRRFARSTGMGLYLVRELCHKMGLTVLLRSEPGCGTTVSIGFPA